VSAAFRLLVASALTGASAAASLPPSAPSIACLTDERVEDVLVVGETVFLAGRFAHVRPPGTGPGDPEEVARLWFAACDARTGAVLGWDPQVTCDPVAFPTCANGPRGQTLALAADGASLYLGGKFREVGGALRRHAARVSLVSAAVDPLWLPEPDDRVQRIVVAPDGARVYVGGTFGQIGGCAPAPCHARLAAVDPVSGAAVAAFDPGVASDGDAFSTVHAIAFDASGETLYLGGQFDSVNGVARTSAAAVDAATGAVTGGFAPLLADANPSDPEVQVYDVRLDGEWVYLCGDWWATAGDGDQQDQRNVNRFEPESGDVDPAFWVATDGGVQACALDPNLGVLFVGGHFDCVREWIDSDTPADPSPSQCGADPLFLGTQQRDLFALSLATGALLPWNPDTGGAAGTWALERAGGRLWTGGEIHWPRTGEPTHSGLLAFDVPLFADGFESAGTGRWSAAFPPP
jgi:hypothetical protein